MKIPQALLMLGIVLMGAALVVPKVVGGRTGLRGELERELVASGELHMASANSPDEPTLEVSQAAQDDLARRVDAALNRGKGIASVLKWLGIASAVVGGIMLAINNTNAESD